MSAWSNEHPTETGWYWWRGSGDDEAELAHIFQAGKMLIARYWGEERTWTASLLRGQWQPVKPPEN